MTTIDLFSRAGCVQECTWLVSAIILCTKDIHSCSTFAAIRPVFVIISFESTYVHHEAQTPELSRPGQSFSDVLVAVFFRAFEASIMVGYNKHPMLLWFESAWGILGLQDDIRYICQRNTVIPFHQVSRSQPSTSIRHSLSCRLIER